jgi:hypothetical protein
MGDAERQTRPPMCGRTVSPTGINRPANVECEGCEDHAAKTSLDFFDRSQNVIYFSAVVFSK